MNFHKNKIKYIAALLLVIACGFLFLFSDHESQGEEVILSSVDEDQKQEEAENLDEQQMDGTASEEPIAVFVCGEVNQPGVYELPFKSRIGDAIEAAGGMTEMAAVFFLNQAELLNDGQKIYIPSAEEAAVMSSTVELAETTGGSNSQEEQSNLIDLNSATKEQLMTLPGIGESKANSILEYRESNGRFSSIEEIKNIRGIKEGVFQKLKDFICV